MLLVEFPSLASAPGAPFLGHEVGSNKPRDPRRTFLTLVGPRSLSGWVLALALLFGGHLADSAGFEGN